MDDRIRDYANSDAIVYAGDDDQITSYDGIKTHDIEKEDPKAKSNRLLAQDMIDFEECINYMGIETRTEDTDHFRNFWSIIYDIGTFLRYNQSFLDDIQGKNFKTEDEHMEFLKGYCFEGVTVTPTVKRMLESN